MYTSPFILEAYAKGMFAIPLGMIESMTIKRGLDEYGWNHSNLPTAVDVTLSIKDLSPAFFLSIADNGILGTDYLFKNTTMQEYISTLSGLGVKERKFLTKKLKARMKALAMIKKNTTFSSTYWAMSVGNNSLVRALAECNTNWKTPD